MNPISKDDLRQDIRAYLEGWFTKAKARQEGKGKAFNLSFTDMLQLWGRRRIRTLSQWMDDGTLYVRQRRSTKDDPNLNGYVLSPVSFSASRETECHAGNMMIATRGEALIKCRMGKGDTHSEKSRARISGKTRGVAKSAAHCQAISKSMTGMKRGPMSQAEKDKRAATVLATLVRKRAEQERLGDA